MDFLGTLKSELFACESRVFHEKVEFLIKKSTFFEFIFSVCLLACCLLGSKVIFFKKSTFYVKSRLLTVKVEF